MDIRHGRGKRVVTWVAGTAATLGVIGLLVWRKSHPSESGSSKVSQPVRNVELHRYLGKWYEIGRYDNRFERGCDEVTAEYSLLGDGLVGIRNSCRSTERSRRRVSRGRAKVLPGSGNAKFKVSFFGPFFIGNYWVMDHDDDYQWSIVSEPTRRYLWILHREAHPGNEVVQQLLTRAADLGFDLSRFRLAFQK